MQLRSNRNRAVSYTHLDVYKRQPQGYANGSNNFATGLPDVNVLARLPSVGGYASIVSGGYNTVTLAHQSGDFNVPQLGNGQFAELDLQDIVTAPEYFLLALRGTPTTLAGVRQMSEFHGQDPVLPMGITANVQGLSLIHI